MASALFGVRNARATWMAIALAAVVMGIAYFAHLAAYHNTDTVPVALDPRNPERTRVGDLVYRGGIDIPPMGQEIGGMSGLRWDGESGRLIAVTDEGRWVRMLPTEMDGDLAGLGEVTSGPLLGENGERLAGKGKGDAEALTRDETGAWAVAFEHDHRIMLYGRGLSESSGEALIDPSEYLGALEANNGIEALAVGERGQLICAQRMAVAGRANCSFFDIETDSFRDFPVAPPKRLGGLGAVPSDADALSDGTFVVLFRSWSQEDGNGIAIVTYAPDGTRRELVTLRPPLSVDNFEGLAVREEEGRTFLYIVSDNNFSSNQRTLLMKFEILPERK